MPEPSPDLLDARAAASLLGVKVPTLYTYASRGWLERVPGPGGRRSLYRRADIDRLKARHDARSGHGAVAAGALRWGEPVVDTVLTSIDERGLRYRGHRAVELSTSGARFEQIVELLWTGELPEEPPVWQARGLGVLPVDFAAALPPGTAPLAALALALPALGARDPGRFGAPLAGDQHRGRRLILRLAALLALGTDVSRCGPSLAQGHTSAVVAHALGIRPSTEACAAIDAALILCADHELNASTFAARVAASTGADLYSCCSAALAALSGPLHGGAVGRVEALVDEACQAERVGNVLLARAGRGEAIPGFGHRLYPQGDPRARYVGP